MRIRTLSRKNQGFILLATMIILILLMIIGLNIYQQVTLSSKTMGTNRFKSLAQNTSVNALNDIEKNKIISHTGIPDKPCVESEGTCRSPGIIEINKLIQYMSSEGKEGGVGAFLEFSKSSETGISVYYLIQNLGKLDPSASSAFIRTTIVTGVMGTIDVIESIYLVADKEVP